jgi:hypothetical protein
VQAGPLFSRRLDALRDRLDPLAQIAELVGQKVDGRSRRLGCMLDRFQQPIDTAKAMTMLNSARWARIVFTVWVSHHQSRRLLKMRIGHGVGSYVFN